MTQPVLSVSNLTTSFLTNGGWKSVVRNVSFSIAPKETLAVVGESGSGKSVTALSIMGLTPPDKSKIGGSIKLGSTELLTLSPAQMRRIRGNEIAMIFQEPMTSLNPVLTIGSQISEALTLHQGISQREAENETVRLLERVRIPSARTRINDYPHGFSGGMRQRVMIAMALACRPKLLIADEPTTALDVTIQAQILDLIKTLQEEEGMAVLFITHDMGVVAEIADRTVVMYSGETVEAGPTAEIFSDPKHAYTRSLLAAVPKLGSLHGVDQPTRFPTVDRITGVAKEPERRANTVHEEDKPVLEVKNLVARFDMPGGFLRGPRGRIHAVENVSFDVRPGETLALVGESGCGKTTAGRCIMRLTTARSGSILLDGADLIALDGSALRAKRKGIQMIFQDPYASLNPRMTAGEAIAEPMLVNKLANTAEAYAKVDELLKRVGLHPEMARRYPHEFSGGQRQRICIARALAVEPQLIVADESVSALDVSVKAQVVNLMMELQERLKLAYLFISHDMAVVERISHRVAVMYLGEIVEIGPRAAIFDNPQHPYTRKLLSAVPVADPSQRQRTRSIVNEEIVSPLRPLDYAPPKRRYRQISTGHLVMDADLDRVHTGGERARPAQA
jgi:peptide/nickel transport system ATP-binding protein